MGNWLKNQLGSYKFWIFVVTLCYFAYAIYFLIYGLTFTVGLIFDQYVYNLVSKNPWWWRILYYGSEGLFGSIAGFIRVFAGCFATYSAYLFWRNGELAFPLIKGAVTKALLLEAAHFVSLGLSVVGSFVYYFSDEPLYYFDGTPALVYLLVAGVPLLAMILVVTPSLLNLRKKINLKAGDREITKWACITGVVYLFVVFWFNYSMSWAGVLVPYTTKAAQQFGLEFLLLPFNFISFVVTVFGLLLLAIFGLKITLPAIQKKPTQLNLQHISVLVTALGSYFLFNVILYYFTGGYAANPSVWYEVIGPLHNPYFWCLSFTFLGIVMMLQFKTKKNKPLP
jgi:hypothetical protein